MINFVLGVVTGITLEFQFGTNWAEYSKVEFFSRSFPYGLVMAFLGLYIAFMLLLVGLILRGVSLELRSQLDHPAWKRVWGAGIVLGSFLPALLLGVSLPFLSGMDIFINGLSERSLRCTIEWGLKLGLNTLSQAAMGI